MVWIPLANGDGQVVKGIKLKDPKTGKTHTVVSTSRKGINRYEITFDDGSKVMNHEIRKKKGSDGWSVVGSFHSPEEIAKLYGKKVDPDANLPRPMRASFWKMKSKPGTHNYKQKKKLMNDPVYIKKFSQFFADTLDEAGLWDNIHAKRERIKKGSGEHMRRPGEKGRPTEADFKNAQEGYIEEISQTTKDRYITKASDEQGMANFAKRQATNPDEKKHFANVERKRRAGLKRAFGEEALQEGPKDAAGKDVFVKKIAKSAGVSYDKAGAIAAAAGRKRMGKEKFQQKVEAGQKAAAKARAQGKKYTGEHK